MGSYHLHIQHPPCANCGKRPGVMGSSAWAQPLGASVCSTACGKRLDTKVRNRMVTFGGDDWHDKRVAALRLRIKVLTHRLKEAK